MGGGSGVLRRMIDKWLSAGVLEEGAVHYPDGGTPQGGVISPLLANLYLHHVLDMWFESMARPKLRGEAFLVRYADDFVIVCAIRRDAEKWMGVLPKRFGKYGLKLHPEKTGLVRFTKPSCTSTGKGGDAGGSGTFDLLGFTHLWQRSRRGKGWVIQRKTAKSRMTRAIRKVSEWCRKNRHRPVAEQFKALASKLRGHYQYFGLTGNGRALKNFFSAVRHEWHRWLNRRSQRNNMKWDRFEKLLQHYVLPKPIVVHSVYVSQRNRDPRSRMRESRTSGSAGGPRRAIASVYPTSSRLGSADVTRGNRPRCSGFGMRDGEVVSGTASVLLLARAKADNQATGPALIGAGVSDERFAVRCPRCRSPQARL